MRTPEIEDGRDGQGGARFRFGANWSRYAERIDDLRVREAVRSLEAALGEDGLDGRTFLDIGCGSGLFSLAARELGAARVHSFDYDADSVATTDRLKASYRPGDDAWSVEQGSALDTEYLRSLGAFDVVYSWGVLHHTGQMWAALENVTTTVGPGGRLFISIYNDQGLRSRIWRAIKHRYCRLPAALRLPYTLAVMGPRELLSLAAHTARGEPMTYVRTWTEYRRQRGMSRWHDLVDWVGGYPFEVAAPDQVFDLFQKHGFLLDRLRTVRGLGCNEFVFYRPDA